MDEQCSSSSTNAIPLLNGYGNTLPTFSFQQSTSSPVSSQMISREWIGPIQVGSKMRCAECMNFIANMSGIQNPMKAYMERIIHRISTASMTNDLLTDMLNDYADLFKINLRIFPFDENMLIDSKRNSLFTGASHTVDSQSEYQHCAFILYDYRQQIFTPLYVHRTDNSPKFCFHDNDYKNICIEISTFIEQWNDRKKQSSSIPIKNITGDNMSSEGLTSTSDVIKNSLQFAFQAVTSLSPELDQIPLKQESTRASWNNFNRASANDKIEMVCNEMVFVTETLRMTTTPDHEEEVEGFLPMETDNGSHSPASDDTDINPDTKIVQTKKNVSFHSKSSTNVKHLRTTTHARNNPVLPEYDPAKILREPAAHQRARMFSDLVAGVCPLIQGGGKDAAQQTYVSIEVPKENRDVLYVAVGAVTVKEVKHPFKSVVPEKSPVDNPKNGDASERSCLKCNKNDFNPDLEYTYLPITPDEHKRGNKEIRAHLINWSRSGTGNKERVIKENLHLCKLEFYFCIRTGPGNYQFVSSPSYSSIIAEGDGPVNITSNADDKKQICEKGGQTIVLSLTVKCAKRGFHVLCNGEKCNDNKFKIQGKNLLIMSPSKEANNANLHLTILRNEYDDDIGENIDRILYDDVFNYISHEDPPAHTCCQTSF